MTEQTSLFSFTATLPPDFFDESPIPFDETHGLSSVDSHSSAYGDVGAGKVDSHAELLRQLPPYHYSSSRDDLSGVGGVDGESATEQRWLYDFEKRGLLGVGGEGQVELALQHSLQREVAIKSLHVTRISKQGPEKLLDEARIIGSLEHPNVIPVHALGRDLAGNPFLVMKKVEGDTWRELLQDEEHAAWERLRFWSDDILVRQLEILLEVCNALEHAHSRGILHRDIKPSNVMVGEFGEVYLLDWGLAFTMAPKQRELPLQEYAESHKPTKRKCMVHGTPVYMAPEMFLCREELLDQRTDVYLLGATLFEVLFQRPPHEGDSLRALADSAWSGATFDESDESLQELVFVCRKALAIEPEQRFQDVSSFRKAIASVLRHRNSVVLWEEARRSHLLFDAMLDNVTPSTQLDVYSSFTETRFGYLRAIDKWAENPQAAEGYQRCLEQMIGFHLQHQRLSDAEALLIQLPEARPALEEKINALRAEVGLHHEQKEIIERLRYELDTSLSHKERLVYTLGIAIPSIIMSVYVLFFKKQKSLITTPMLLWLALLVMGILIVSLALGRQFWSKNTFDRRFLYFSAIITGAICFHRWIGYMMNQEPSEIMIVDLCIASVVTLSGSLFFQPLVFLSVVSGSLAFVAVWYAEYARELFTVYAMSVMCFLFILYILSRQRKRSHS